MTPQGLAVVQCTKGAARREINKAHGYGGIYLGNANNLLLIVECTYCVYSRCVMVNADWASCPGIVHEGIQFSLVLENVRVFLVFLSRGGSAASSKPKKQGKQDTVTQEHGDPGPTCDQKERDRTGKAGGGRTQDSCL